MYTKKERREIERLLELFQDYLQDDEHTFTVIWAEKFGYLWIYAATIERREFFCDVILSAEQLMQYIFFEMRQDFEVAYKREYGDCLDIPEAAFLMMPDFIKNYLERVPEYRYLLDELAR